MTTTQLFAVISWGCAATSWLSKALNSHPEVFCSHAANYFWSKHGGAPHTDGMKLMEVCDAIGDEAYLAAGDVHGMRRDDVPFVRDFYGDRFRAAVIVREPIARLRSQVALFVQGNYAHWTGLEYLDPIIASAGFDPKTLTIEQRHFFHATNLLNAILEERSVGPIFRMEDITTQPEKFLDLFLHLTGEQVPFSPAWAEAAVRSRRANIHRGNSEIFFNSVEKKIIDCVVKPDAWEAYRDLGYSYIL